MRLTTPPGHVGRREHLGQRHRRERPRLRRQQHDRVARHDRRREPRHQPEQRGRLRRDDPDDAGRLGDREVEVARRDRVHRAQHLRDLVGPARVPDPAIDRPIDQLAGARASDTPSASATSCSNCSRRPSISSATRYRIWPRFIAVRSSQPANAPRAARTASRTSLREPRTALASGVPSAARTTIRATRLGARELRRRCTACRSCARRSARGSARLRRRRPWRRRTTRHRVSFGRHQRPASRSR